METKRTAIKDIDDYIAGFPPDVQAILQEVRGTIREAAPAAEETISYQMPTFKLAGKYLVYFAAYKKHISLYPAPLGIAEFEEELAVYGSGKGTLKFSLDKPIPYELITNVVNYWLRERLAKAEGKKK